MVCTCCVVGCNVRSHDREGKKQREGFHISDITKQRHQAWIAAVRRADIEFSAIPNLLLVCSRHFLSGEQKSLICWIIVLLFLALQIRPHGFVQIFGR
uniref:THAP-type domain-containing protein n=1 Tax=Neolamprologus brichardi TaxID=32507 RepID=A0A3Q4I1K5_NEOBR